MVMGDPHTKVWGIPLRNRYLSLILDEGLVWMLIGGPTKIKHEVPPKIPARQFSLMRVIYGW